MRALLLFFLVLRNTQGFRNIASVEEAGPFCKHQKHMVLNPEYSCCNFEVVKNGLMSNEGWASCSTSESSAATVQKAAWGVYGCLIKAANKDSSISLSQFAQLVSASYPDDIKSKIVEKAGTLSASADLSDENFAALDKLRILYYGIEREVCEGSPVPLEVTTCSHSDEQLHRGGECCKETSFPFPVTYASWMGADMREEQKTCRRFINSTLIGSKKGYVPEIMLANLGEMCDSMCVMLRYSQNPQEALGVYEWSVIMGKLSPYIKHLLPPWVPGGIAAEAINFAEQNVDVNQTIDEMALYEFSDAVPGNHSGDTVVHYTLHINTTLDDQNKTIARDFAGRRFPHNLLHIPVHCTIVKRLLAYVEMRITGATDCVAAPPPETPTEAPATEAPAAEAEETSSSSADPSTEAGNEGASTDTPESSAGDPAE